MFIFIHNPLHVCCMPCSKLFIFEKKLIRVMEKSKELKLNNLIMFKLPIPLFVYIYIYIYDPIVVSPMKVCPNSGLGN